jgi:hypothetical protein
MLLAGRKHVKEGLLKLLRHKARGEATLIVTLILIAISVGLCLYFRTEILAIMSNALSGLSSTITTMLSEATAP